MIAQNRAGVNISKVEIGIFSQPFVEKSLNYRLQRDGFAGWGTAH